MRASAFWLGRPAIGLAKRLLLWGLLLLGSASGSACGPEFPSFWLIEPDPLGPDGQIDAAGKLRVLAIQADPPEVGPDSEVRLSALVVTHPQHGEPAQTADGTRPTTQPQGLSALWLACRQPSETVSPEPCGLEQLNRTTELRRLVAEPPVVPPPFPGPPLFARLRTFPGSDVPYTLLVTLIVADRSLPGGAEACYAQAMGSRGVSPNQNHCLIAIKALRVSPSPSPNHNPGIRAVAFGPDGGALDEQTMGSPAFRYPKLSPSTPDSDRPKLTLAVDRAADAVEVGQDTSGQPKNESLSATFFTTAGTLEAGRGSFLDLDCPGAPETCPQFPRTSVTWQPPTARADREAPAGLIHFFLVVRDDRGGLSFAHATATPQ